MHHTRETLRQHNGPIGWLVFALMLWMAWGVFNPADFKKSDKATTENVK